MRNYNKKNHKQNIKFKERIDYLRKKTYNNSEIRKILENNGYHCDRQTGGHLIYKSADNSKTITISVRKTNKMVFQRLIKEYDLKEAM